MLVPGIQKNRQLDCVLKVYKTSLVSKKSGAGNH
jgi:hypothetical protein